MEITKPCDKYNGFTFVLEGKPIGKGRPRFGKGHAYTPGKTRDEETLIKRKLLSQISRQKIKDFLDLPVDITICRLPEKTIVEIKYNRTDEETRKQLFKKPDADNHLKLLLDAFNGILYNDDRQVTGIKYYKY